MLLRMLAENITPQTSTGTTPRQKNFAFFVMLMLVLGIYFFYLSQ